MILSYLMISIYAAAPAIPFNNTMLGIGAHREYTPGDSNLFQEQRNRINAEQRALRDKIDQLHNLRFIPQYEKTLLSVAAGDLMNQLQEDLERTEFILQALNRQQNVETSILTTANQRRIAELKDSKRTTEREIIKVADKLATLNLRNENSLVANSLGENMTVEVIVQIRQNHLEQLFDDLVTIRSELEFLQGDGQTPSLVRQRSTRERQAEEMTQRRNGVNLQGVIRELELFPSDQEVQELIVPIQQLLARTPADAPYLNVILRYLRMLPQEDRLARLGDLTNLFQNDNTGLYLSVLHLEHHIQHPGGPEEISQNIALTQRLIQEHSNVEVDKVITEFLVIRSRNEKAELFRCMRDLIANRPTANIGDEINRLRLHPREQRESIARRVRVVIDRAPVITEPLILQMLQDTRVLERQEALLIQPAPVRPAPAPQAQPAVNAYEVHRE